LACIADAASSGAAGSVYVDPSSFVDVDDVEFEGASDLERHMRGSGTSAIVRANDQTLSGAHGSRPGSRRRAGAPVRHDCVRLVPGGAGR
jgi:hypothetical protein